MAKGLFIVFEGIDGSGKSNQVGIFGNHLRKLSEEDILITSEPWKGHQETYNEIRRILGEDRAPEPNGRKLAELYVMNRSYHLKDSIIPALDNGQNVVGDRGLLSTFAIQGTQGLSYDEIVRLHKKARAWEFKPDLTFYLDVGPEVAERRVRQKYGQKDKFERNSEFTESIIDEYRLLVKIGQQDQNLFGKIVRINGNNSVEDVSRAIKSNFGRFYNRWNLNQ